MTEVEQAAPEAAPEDVTEEKVTTETESTEEGEGQETPPAEGEETPEKKTASQERRERRKAHEQRLQEEAAASRKEAATARAKLERIRNPGELPKESDFADVIEYAAAMGAYKARQSEAQLNAQYIEEDAKAAESVADQRDQERLKERASAFEDNKAEAKQRYADFDQAMIVAQSPDVVSQELSLLVLESDNSADLAYHLGKNPDFARQLSRMPPIRAAWELGRIEATLSAPKARTETNAPAPITPVRPKGTAAKSPDTMTNDEYRAARQAGQLK